MTRTLLCLPLLLWLAPTTAAQDMPLSQILIEGEGWKKVPWEKPPQRFPGVLAGTRAPDGQRPTAYLIAWADRTLYVGYPEGDAIVAFALDGARTPRSPVPYCPLRLKRGTKGIGVVALETDDDGRIYAATEIGVQVFDPTGRLCGVLTPAAPGKPEFLAFEGDRLTMWIKGEKYARKLNATGAK